MYFCYYFLELNLETSQDKLLMQDLWEERNPLYQSNCSSNIPYTHLFSPLWCSQDVERIVV